MSSSHNLCQPTASARFYLSSTTADMPNDPVSSLLKAVWILFEMSLKSVVVFHSKVTGLFWGISSINTTVFWPQIRNPFKVYFYFCAVFTFYYKQKGDRGRTSGSSDTVFVWPKRPINSSSMAVNMSCLINRCQCNCFPLVSYHKSSQFCHCLITCLIVCVVGCFVACYTVLQ